MKQNNFNFLRFYFAFIVVISHLLEISMINSFVPFKQFFNTYISVTAFFCISGFLITYSYLNTPKIKEYFIKRAARLLPAYVLVIITSAFALSLISKYTLYQYFSHPHFYKFLAANLSFLNFIQPTLPGVFTNNAFTSSVNGALWTLKVEVGFYLVIPIILYFVEKTNRKYLLLIGIYICSIIYKSFFEYLALYNEKFILLARQLPGFLSYFVSGIALYYYFDTFIKYKSKLFIAGVIVYLFEHFIGCEIFTPFALPLIIFSIAYSMRSLNNFAKKVDISYGIYIYHFPIIQIAIFYDFFNRYNPFLVAFTIIAIVMLISYSSWLLVEKRFLKRA